MTKKKLALNLSKTSIQLLIKGSKKNCKLFLLKKVGLRAEKTQVLKIEYKISFRYYAAVLSTLEYLITVQHLLNVHYGKLDFIWLAKKDNLMLLN